MKTRILISVFVVLFLSSCGGSYLVLQMPKFYPLGLGTKTTLSIFNPTPYFAKIAALDVDSVCMISPNGSAWGSVNVGFEGEQYPLIAWLCNKKGDTLGVSFTAPNLYSNTPHNWVIEWVSYPDGRNGHYAYGNRTSPFPPTKAGNNTEVDFPSTSLGTTVYVQLINCTYYVTEGRLGLKGLQVPDMRALSSFTLPYENVLRINGNVPLNILYKDRNYSFGWQKTEFSVSTNNVPRAVQFLFTPHGIRQSVY